MWPSWKLNVLLMHYDLVFNLVQVLLGFILSLLLIDRYISLLSSFLAMTDNICTMSCIFSCAYAKILIRIFQQSVCSHKMQNSRTAFMITIVGEKFTLIVALLRSRSLSLSLSLNDTLKLVFLFFLQSFSSAIDNGSVVFFCSSQECVFEADCLIESIAVWATIAQHCQSKHIAAAAIGVSKKTTSPIYTYLYAYMCVYIYIYSEVLIYRIISIYRYSLSG